MLGEAAACQAIGMGQPRQGVETLVRCDTSSDLFVSFAGAGATLRHIDLLDRRAATANCRITAFSPSHLVRWRRAAKSVMLAPEWCHGGYRASASVWCGWTARGAGRDRIGRGREDPCPLGSCMPERGAFLALRRLRLGHGLGEIRAGVTPLLHLTNTAAVLHRMACFPYTL